MNGEEKKLFGEQQRTMGRIEAQQENIGKKLDKVVSFIDEKAATKDEVHEIKEDVKNMRVDFEAKCITKNEVGVIMKDHMQDEHDREKIVGHAVMVNKKYILWGLLLIVASIATYFGIDLLKYIPWG